ncbi:daptide-type RiPP [Streptomyces sp. TM32]|nr:daptide-type RiPP [Streptomyces sp. TM32]
MNGKTDGLDLDLSFEELEDMAAPSFTDKATKIVVIGGILVGIATT